MSNAYNAVASALAADATLREQVMAASSSDERAALLVAAGLELPTPEEVDAAKLAGVAGGSAGPGSTDLSNAVACAEIASASVA